MTESQGWLNLPVNARIGWKVDAAKFYVLPANTTGGVGPAPSSFDCVLTPSSNNTGATFGTLMSAKLPTPVPATMLGEFPLNADVTVWFEVSVSDSTGKNKSTFTAGSTTVKAKALTRPK